jgi:hypothetical protein
MNIRTCISPKVLLTASRVPSMRRDVRDLYNPQISPNLLKNDYVFGVAATGMLCEEWSTILFLGVFSRWQA